MTHRTRPARTPLLVSLAALALLHACAFAAHLQASQTPVLPVQTPVGPSTIDEPVKKEWLLYALRSRQHQEAALVRLVERRRSSFLPTAEDEKELRAAGATDRLLEAVRKNYVQPKTSGMGEGPLPIRVGSVAPLGGGGPGNPGSADYTRTFPPNEVTRKARITYKPDPAYPEKARKNQVEGVVRLRAVLNSSGEVSNIQIVKGMPDGLSEQAIAAARQIKFTPAEKDGHKVSQYVVLEYSFEFPWNEEDVVERAIILEKPEAEYTEEARRNNVRGKVVLKVTLTSYGRVAVNSVEAGLPHGLNEKAVEAASRIKFEPARGGGGAVSQRATVEYLFGP